MSKFKKIFIGKGTKVENMDIVRLSLKVEEVLKHKHEYAGDDYITFEVAKLQQPDRFGRSHTAYVSVKEEIGDEKPQKATKK